MTLLTQMLVCQIISVTCTTIKLELGSNDLKNFAQPFVISNKMYSIEM